MSVFDGGVMGSVIAVNGGLSHERYDFYADGIIKGLIGSGGD